MALCSVLEHDACPDCLVLIEARKLSVIAEYIDFGLKHQLNEIASCVRLDFILYVPSTMF